LNEKPASEFDECGLEGKAGLAENRSIEIALQRIYCYRFIYGY